MLTYFDPISLENVELDDTTILYLVKQDDNFLMKGVSSGIDQLPHDPTTRATSYWLINTETLIKENLLINSKFFPNDELSNSAFTASEIKDFFGFDPNDIAPQAFNIAIGRALVREWTDDIMGNQEEPIIHIDEIPALPREAFLEMARLERVRLETARLEVARHGNFLSSLVEVMREIFSAEQLTRILPHGGGSSNLATVGVFSPERGRSLPDDSIHFDLENSSNGLRITQIP